MSKANIGIVRRIWDAVEPRHAEASFALYDPAIVLDNSTVPGPLAGVYRGKDGMRQFSQEWRESFEAETYRTHPEAFIDAGKRVVVGIRLTARGAASGAEVEMRRWNVYEIRNSLVARIDIFETEAQAFEAAGVEASAPPRANVEIVRQALAAFNRGDLDSTLAAVDPEVEWTTSAVVPPPATYHGHAGVRELHALLRDSFEEIHWEPDRFFATGDTVVVLGRVGVRGRGSGAMAESERAWVFALREGKVVRQQTYSDQQEALEAIGL